MRAGPDAPRFRAAVLAAAREAASALGFDPAVRLEGPLDGAVEPRRAEQAIAVLREALTNAARHAQANNVDVAVSVTGDQLRVAVADDGVGLGRPSRHSGLDNLQKRAELLGGRLVVFAGSAGGTRLEWAVPLNGQSAPETAARTQPWPPPLPAAENPLPGSHSPSGFRERDCDSSSPGSPPPPTAWTGSAAAFSTVSYFLPKKWL